MIETDFLKHLDRLSLIINKRITSNYTGDRIAQAQGSGVVFKDYVSYATGDDYRAVDWKVYARTEKLFIKRFEEERNLTVHVITDFSGSMGFGTKKMKKSDYASMVALGFAYMALKNNEKFVLSTFAESLEFLRPKRGRAQLANCLDRLNSKKAHGSTKFLVSLMRYKKLINTKSFVVIISDFLYPVDEIRTVLHRLRKHDVRLIQVLDPIEAELALDGDFKLKDAETDEVMRTYISPGMRKSYLGQLREHQDKIRQACDETGARFFTASTEKPIFDTFYEVLQTNGRQRLG
jgi:uncharacterized protein (DUF58 family)